MGGTLGRYGSSSVEKYGCFFFYTIANLTKTVLKKTEIFFKLRADR